MSQPTASKKPRPGSSPGLPRTRSGGKPLPRCIEPGFVPSEEVDPEGMRKLMAEIMATAVAGYRQARDPRKRASILAWFEDRDNPHIFGCASICSFLSLSQDWVVKKLLQEKKRANPKIAMARPRGAPCPQPGGALRRRQ